jgi:hypothetical protein
MADIAFWGAEEDQNKIVESIFALGKYGLMPDIHYDDPHPHVYTKPSPNLLGSLQKKKRIFISGPFSKASPTMRRLKSGSSDGGYFIYETTGGPFLMLILPGYRSVEGIAELAPGDFYYRSEYWDEAITHPIKPSDDLKEHHKIILKAVKPHLVRKPIGPEKSMKWIGRAAWKLLEDGKAIILSNGKWWDRKGNFVKSNLDSAAASRSG